jgi:hypothetical protein
MLRSTSEFNIRGNEGIKMKVGNELKFRLHVFCDVDFFPPGYDRGVEMLISNIRGSQK